MGKGFDMKIALLLLLALCTLVGSNAFAVRYAVLIGIEQYQYLGTLPGPVNDCEKMRRLLIDRYGIAPAQMTMLLNRDAVKPAIQRAISEWLPGNVQAGDEALVYFSGHGTQVKDYNGDEADGRDEAFICQDCPQQLRDYNGLIVDDELSRWITQVHAAGATVTLIADSCHSGTMTRETHWDDALVARYVRFDEDPPAPAMTGRGAGPEFADCYLVAGCRDDQLSFSNRFEDVGAMGVLTYHLLRALQQPDNRSYAQLGYALQHTVSAWYAQEPRVDGPDLSRAFLGHAGMPTGATSNLPPVTGGDQLNLYLDGFGAREAGLRDVLRGLSYVRVVADLAQADRVLAAEKGEDGSARLLRRDTSLEDQAEAPTVNELIETLRPGLMRAVLLKRLATTHRMDAKLTVQISLTGRQGAKDIYISGSAYNPDGNTVKKGATVTFTARTSDDCYLTLIDLPNRGLPQPLFPFKEQQNNLVTGNTDILLLPLGSGHHIKAQDVGRDIVLAIASRRPLPLDFLKIPDQFEKGLPFAPFAKCATPHDAEKLLGVVADKLGDDGIAVGWVMMEVVE